MAATLKHPEDRRILIVDDEEDIRDIIRDFLTMRGYHMFTAKGAPEAFGLLEESVRTDSPIHLVISDINMPGMKGFEFLQEVEKRYPRMNRVLITAYDVDDYLGKCIEYGIGNIISKSAPFNFAELESVVYALLTEDIFGVERYLHPGSEFTTVKICTDQDIETYSQKVAALLPEGKIREHLKLALVEMLYNALIYGVMQFPSENKIDIIGKLNIPPEKAVRLTFGRDHEKVGVSVEDGGGRLKKGEVLYWLDRQTSTDDSGIPKGLYDFHGRGFFLVRKYVDRLIINIKKDVKTELVMIKYFTPVLLSHKAVKPIYINEI